MKKWKQEAVQKNYGYFEVEAETAEEAEKLIAEMIEDDFIRETGEWEIGEVEEA